MNEQRKEFAELFEHMSDAAIVVDEAQKQVVACNPPFVALVTRSFPSLIERDVPQSLTFERNSVEDCAQDRSPYTRATVFAGGECRLHVEVECLACHWQEREATLCLIKRVDREPEAQSEEVTSDEASALFE